MRELLVVVALGCQPAAVVPPPAIPEELPVTPAPATVPTWSVYDGEMLILTFRGEPGPITSTAMLPPGVRPVTHPFLSAAAREAGHESQLRELLDASTSVEDFLARLRAAGFRVESTG
jgi:hypothetical protein